MQLIKATLLLSSALGCSCASPLFKRQARIHIPLREPSDLLPDSWIAAYEAAEAAGKLVDIAPALAGNGGEPYYPAGVDTSSSGVCSWTMVGCLAPDDLSSAPDGRWAVSFDDGPTAASPTLYDFLESMNQSATHFMIGGNIASRPDLFQQAVESGGHIAIHTWSHPYMSTLTDLQVLGELGWTAQVIYDLSGFVPAFWRPPYGDVDNRVRAIAKEVFGLTTTIWNEDTDDWCLSEGGGSSCAGEGPADDAALDALMLGFAAKSKSPGLMVLEHELSSRSIGGFTRNYQSLISSGWDLLSIAEAWSLDWYLNSPSNAGPVDSSIIVGGGEASPSVGQGNSTAAESPSTADPPSSTDSPSTSNSPSTTAFSRPVTTVTITPSPLTTVTIRVPRPSLESAVGQPLAGAAAQSSGVENRAKRVCLGVLALLVATVAWLLQAV